MRNPGVADAAPAPPGATPAPGGKLAAFWLSWGCVFALDWGSKWLVTHTMFLQQSLPLAGDLVRLTYVRNTGAAFSLLADFHSPWRTLVLISVPVLALTVLTVMAWRERQKGWPLLVPLGLVCGGALGNLKDRAFSGTVVDFLDAGVHALRWPVFNVADSAVVIGVIWLLLITLQQRPELKKP